MLTDRITGETKGLGPYSQPVLSDRRALIIQGPHERFTKASSKEDHELVIELFEKLPAWLENGAVKPSFFRDCMLFNGF